MANKRELKKKIQYVCGDICADIILATYLSPEVDRARAEALIVKLAALQDEAIDRVSFHFDKAVKDFPTPADYNKARAAYNAKAFANLRNDFSEKVNEVVKEMNTLVPADVRKEVSE